VPILVAALVAALVGWFSHGRRDEGLEPDVEPYGGHRDHHPGRQQDASRPYPGAQGNEGADPGAGA
jgi:hypothetical protein